MNMRKRTVMPLLAATLAVPALSYASSEWHAPVGEAVVTSHPDHVKSKKTRAEAQAEVEAARKDGTLERMSRGAPLPPKGIGPAKTRQQVVAEMENETADERRARANLLAGS